MDAKVGDVVAYEDRANPRREYAVEAVSPLWGYALRPLDGGDNITTDGRQPGWEVVDTTITGQEILDLAHEILGDKAETRYVEQTGGGVATIFVGEPRQIATEWDDEWWVHFISIGPGYFAPHAVFDFVELYVGPDEPDADTGVYVHDRAELRAVLERYAVEPDWRDTFPAYIRWRATSTGGTT